MKPFEPYQKNKFGNYRTGNYTELSKDVSTPGDIIQYGTASASLGDTTITGTLNVIGSVTVSVDLDVTGDITADDITSDTINLNEQTADPPDPAEGKATLWMSDGTATGDDGDILFKEQSGAAIETISLKHKEFYPSSMTVNTGTLVSGTFASVTEIYDGVLVTVDEVTGVPGYDVEFGFTNVDRYPNYVVCMWRYDGSSTHFCTIDIYDYVAAGWGPLRMYKDSSLYSDSMTMYLPIVNAAKVVDGSGNAKLRFYHHTSGNSSHDVHIDYVALVHSLQGVI